MTTDDTTAMHSSDAESAVSPAAVPQHADPRQSGVIRWLLGALLVLSTVVAGLGWVLASPVGGSPDDDYHLASIWCPRPVEGSCRTRIIDGEVNVLVPEPIAKASTCYAFKQEVSAACTLPYLNENDGYTRRYDDGNYPKGYYRFHHLFISESVNQSVLLMRTVNMLISVALLGAIGALIPALQRRGYAVALLIAWVPMGIYYVASNNPSSWALTGTFAFATGMLGALNSRGVRRWVLVALAALGGLLCISSRGDSAFFLFVIAMALVFAIQWRRMLWPYMVFLAVASAVGVFSMFSTGQSTVVTSSDAELAFTPSGPVETLVRATLQVPLYIAGFYGYNRGPGWFDTPINEPTVLVMLFIFGGALIVGLAGGTWRKWLSALMIFGALIGVPIAVTVRGYYPTLWHYQPRYMLPLLAVFLFILFVVDSRTPAVLSRVQSVVVGFGISAAYCLALQMTLWRYTAGVNSGDPPLNLDRFMQWWWPIPMSPTVVWTTSSLAFAATVILAFVLTRPPAREPADR
ncbi:DUF2142 domain-containing protein [Actinomyces mediterranea]|uniref:DUF2142 domain-containing protein n=1 Tax=Actinomyces mediterranea TaxID=1871028 RepID=UPI0009F8451A|nr:DUF2142 domain-containing protein [Actinomyces mediterranea]